MLDPRIYRTGLAAVVLGVIVFAFSLANQQTALSSNLAPDAYSPSAVSSAMSALASAFPNPRPGSPQDRRFAAYMATSFTDDHFVAATDTFSAATRDGMQTLQTVTGTRTGISNGTIVVLAPRDLRGPAAARASGTAVLLQLAQVLQNQTHHRTIMLASVNGSVGAAGATRLAHRLAGASVAAVIVLGDLARRPAVQPTVVPFSGGQELAPTLLRNTLGAALASQGAVRSTTPSIADEVAHLAFPMTTSNQGPFAPEGEPALLLSAAGEPGPTRRESIDPAAPGAIGTAVLQTIDALDAGPPPPGPSAYLLFDGKVVPYWAIRLLVLVLILPVLGSAIDAAARSRRRGHRLTRWLGWVLAGAVPFLLALLTLRAAQLAGVLAAPPGPAGAGAAPPHDGEVALLVVLALVVAASFWLLRPFCIALATRLSRLASRRSESARAGGTPRARRIKAEDESAIGTGTGAALLVVLVAVALAAWAWNPMAALLMVPALHLWMWVVDPDVLMPRLLAVALWLVGLLPPALVIAYYVHHYSLSALDVVWSGVLMLAGGQIGVLAAVLWSVALGCVASVLVIALRMRRELRAQPKPVTVRGPVTYAGPGSLGGTDSAVRRPLSRR